MIDRRSAPCGCPIRICFGDPGWVAQHTIECDRRAEWGRLNAPRCPKCKGTQCVESACGRFTVACPECGYGAGQEQVDD